MIYRQFLFLIKVCLATDKKKIQKKTINLPPFLSCRFKNIFKWGFMISIHRVNSDFPDFPWYQFKKNLPFSA